MRKFLLDCAELGAIITYLFIGFGAAAYGSFGLLWLCGLGLFFALVSFIEKVLIAKVRDKAIEIIIKEGDRMRYKDPKGITFAEIKTQETKSDGSIEKWKLYERMDRRTTTERFLTPVSLESLTDKLATTNPQELEHIFKCFREEVEVKKQIIEQEAKKKTK